jgi:hypothetical protein
MKPFQYRFRFVMTIGFVLSLVSLLMAQTAPAPAPRKALVVNGKTLDEAVVQVDGRSYVDVEALAQATGGAVTIEAGRVVLVLAPAPSVPPAPEAGAGGTVPAAVPATLPDAMSRDFMRTAVASLAEMREWRGAAGAVVTFGIPVTGSWPQDYRDRVENSLEQVTVAASNGADRDALQLLQNEEGNLRDWADQVIGARQALNAAQSIDPNALQNDKTLQKISACGDFLNSMIVSGTYSDNANCH